MFDDSRDFIQTHYTLSKKSNTQFWMANKRELKISDSLIEKMNIFNSGMIVCPPVTTNESSYYGDIEKEFYNFWTNSNYYCIFSGLGHLPSKVNSEIAENLDWVKTAFTEFLKLKEEEFEMLNSLPSMVHYLKNIRGAKPID